MNKNITVVPVLVLNTIEEAKQIAALITEANFTHLEVTLRTPQALKIIDYLAANHPLLTIGAGTILNKQDAKRAIESGADFFVSPGITTTLVEQMKPYHHCWYGGVSTISEAMILHTQGINVAKLFPAELVGGVAWLKSAHAVLPNLSFFPTGGITLANLSDYLSADNVSFIGGTWLASRADLDDKNFSHIKQNFSALTTVLDQYGS